MSIDDGVRALLLGDPGVIASGVTAASSWPAPAGTVGPFVTWRRKGGESVASFAGPSGLDNTVLQIDCWSETEARRNGGDAYEEARGVAKAVRRLLNGYQGRLDGVDAGILLLSTPSDEFDPETRMVYVSMDFSIWHEEE